MAFWKSLSLFLLMSMLSVKNVQCRQFERCSMAKELFFNQGFPANELSDWVCLIQHESSFDTKAMNKHNTDDSYDWGLFQINDMYWCNPHRSGFHPEGNGCGINCQELLSSDISTASRCAQHIRMKSGFKAWKAWEKHCEGRHYDLSDCGIPGLTNRCSNSFSH